MTKTLFSLTALALTLAVNAQGGNYTLNSSLTGQAFLDAFLWEAIPDPTNGDVCVHPDVSWKDGEMCV